MMRMVFAQHLCSVAEWLYRDGVTLNTCVKVDNVSGMSSVDDWMS